MFVVNLIKTSYFSGLGNYFVVSVKYIAGKLYHFACMRDFGHTD